MQTRRQSHKSRSFKAKMIQNAGAMNSRRKIANKTKIMEKSYKKWEGSYCQECVFREIGQQRPADSINMTLATSTNRHNVNTLKLYINQTGSRAGCCASARASPSNPASAFSTRSTSSSSSSSSAICIS